MPDFGVSSFVCPSFRYYFIESFSFVARDVDISGCVDVAIISASKLTSHAVI